VLEDAIKRQVGRIQEFQLELVNYLDLLPEGLDAQSLLLILPPFAAMRQNVAQLQLEFDKAHLVRESDDIVQWLALDVRLFLDPYEAMSARKSKTVAISKATILNHLTAMCAGVVKMRNFAITAPFPHELDSSVERIVHVVQNHVVLPRRGVSRRRSASVKPATTSKEANPEKGAAGRLKKSPRSGGKR
jgi:hypothetical protein